ncbi:MAG TPA: monovalent cation/H(+) antiporter subunit G [Mesorhizobium sp.]|jgi:multicomponent Na+:H+ antiporter subunit G|nr:monovalent cation/H(+) antiporter subunit G [Mesorhizobium sp.]
MTDDILNILVGVLVLAGSCFVLVAGVGLLRLPDLFSRMHAASKAGALGSGFVLLGVAFGSGDPDVTLRALAGIVFVLVTTPVAAHLLAKAALDTGQRPWAVAGSTAAAKGTLENPRVETRSGP